MVSRMTSETHGPLIPPRTPTWLRADRVAWAAVSAGAGVVFAWPGYVVAGDRPVGMLLPAFVSGIVAFWAGRAREPRRRALAAGGGAGLALGAWFAWLLRDAGGISQEFLPVVVLAVAVAGLAFGEGARFVIAPGARAKEAPSHDDVDVALLRAGVWLLGCVSLVWLLYFWLPFVWHLITAALAVVIAALALVVWRDGQRLLWLGRLERGEEPGLRVVALDGRGRRDSVIPYASAYDVVDADIVEHAARTPAAGTGSHDQTRPPLVRVPVSPERRAAPFVRRCTVAVLALALAGIAASRAAHYARAIPLGRVSML